MECLIGIQFKDFVLVAADMTTTQSILVVKNGKKKISVENFVYIISSTMSLHYEISPLL